MQMVAEDRAGSSWFLSGLISTYLAIPVDPDARVGGPEIDTNHILFLVLALAVSAYAASSQQGKGEKQEPRSCVGHFPEDGFPSKVKKNQREKKTETDFQKYRGVVVPGPQLRGERERRGGGTKLWLLGGSQGRRAEN
jgi:hypothetical protein